MHDLGHVGRKDEEEEEERGKGKGGEKRRREGAASLREGGGPSLPARLSLRPLSEGESDGGAGEVKETYIVIMRYAPFIFLFQGGRLITAACHERSCHLRPSPPHPHPLPRPLQLLLASSIPSPS